MEIPTSHLTTFLTSHQKDFFLCKKRKNIKSLEDYYFIKGVLLASGTDTLTKVLLEDQEKICYQQKFRNIVVVLLLVILMKAAMLASIFASRHSHSINHTETGSARKYHRLFDFAITAIPSPMSSSSTAVVALFPTMPFIRRGEYRPKLTSLWGIGLQSHMHSKRSIKE